jgi:hypothetical protein
MSTLHRNAAGYVTKFADSGIAEDEAILLASTKNVDRMGDIVLQSGIDFRTFMASGGPILRDHNSG